MKNFKKALFTSTVTALTLSAGLSFAQDTASANNMPFEDTLVSKPKAVLFKIHDIKPLTDTEGNVQSCEYTVTFFNRTNTTIRQAKMDLEWKDSMSSLFLTEEKEEKTQKEDTDKNKAKQNAKEVQKDDPDTIRATLNIPSINPLKKVVLKGNVQTEKCFALFDNVSFQISDCSTLNAQESSNARVNRANDAKNQAICASLFSYVDSKNPEYYDEFKEVSYEEEVKTEKEVETNENSFIEQAKTKIDSQVEKIKEVLAKIK